MAQLCCKPVANWRKRSPNGANVDDAFMVKAWCEALTGEETKPVTKTRLASRISLGSKVTTREFQVTTYSCDDVTCVTAVFTVYSGFILNRTGILQS